MNDQNNKAPLNGGRPRRPLTKDDMARMNLGRRYWEVSLDVIPETMPYKGEVISYLAKLDRMIANGWGLFLWGPNATGKTALAAIVAKEAKRHGYTVFFIGASEYADSIIRRKPFDDVETIEERCKSVDMLVLDDLGKENRSEAGFFIETELEELVRARSNNCKATVITSNMNRTEGQEVYKESMLDVMQATIHPVKVAGMNFRLDEKKQLDTALVG